MEWLHTDVTFPTVPPSLTSSGKLSECETFFFHSPVDMLFFPVFPLSSYAAGAVRLSAISGFGVLYIMTHDSIGLGEDGVCESQANDTMLGI
jgi:hypothetical protein